MGVIVGRFPGKARNSFWEERKRRMLDAARGFVAFAENLGLAVSEREYQVRKEVPGSKILTGLESYGVAACDMGTDFWKLGK